ncbi:hypothetical protein C8Q79DRAFT_217766 [Trametes meyenii]|nr:hypothetical protein C8Q79DRAFT_217766 [Trametes meyenii]
MKYLVTTALGIVLCSVRPIELNDDSLRLPGLISVCTIIHVQCAKRSRSDPKNFIVLSLRTPGPTSRILGFSRIVHAMYPTMTQVTCSSSSIRLHALSARTRCRSNLSAALLECLTVLCAHTRVANSALYQFLTLRDYLFRGLSVAKARLGHGSGISRSKYEMALSSVKALPSVSTRDTTIYQSTHDVRLGMGSLSL